MDLMAPMRLATARDVCGLCRNKVLAGTAYAERVAASVAAKANVDKKTLAVTLVCLVIIHY